MLRDLRIQKGISRVNGGKDNENNICRRKDLEDLACHLSLNSNEYHDLIISAFKQIWLDVVEIHPKFSLVCHILEGIV